MTAPANTAEKAAPATCDILEHDALTAEVLKHGRITVLCHANRGRQYRVTFTAESGGDASVVESVFRRWNDTGCVYRTIWVRNRGRRMTPLVASAIRVAVEQALKHVKVAAIAKATGATP